MRLAGEILTALAEKLPDGVLQENFPDLPPKKVRQILQDTAAIVTPQKGAKVASCSQTTLWQDAGQDWKGGLKGKILHLYTDGASRGNPGKAGAGIAILDEQGNELVGAAEYLGVCTNNEAEYKALLCGLSRCGEFGRGRLKIHLDSELVVKQILGQYRVKHPNLIPLFNQTRQRLSQFASYTIIHVRREKNSRADQLANQAIDNPAK